MNSSPDLNMHVRFATLSDYFKLIQNDSFASLSGDFFTYADREDHYWSGYFTTRPFYKRFDRILESFLRSTEVLFTWNSILGKDICQSKEIREQLEYVRQSLALFQHHDAITGTAREVVVNDYAQRMHTSLLYSQSIIQRMLHSLTHNEQLTPLSASTVKLLHVFPDRNSLSQPRVLNLLNDERVALLAFNSLPHSRQELLCFRIDLKSSWTLSDSEGKEIPVQISYIWQGLEPATDQIEVCFMASLKPLSISTFNLMGREVATSFTFSHVTLYNFHTFSVPDNDLIAVKESADEIIVESDTLRLVLSGHDGLLKRTIYQKELRVYETLQQFLTFGTRKQKKESKSGAYLFLPGKMQ